MNVTAASLVLLLSSAVSSAAQTAALAGRLSGTVVSDRGQPIAGARVDVRAESVDRSVATGPDGTFVFEQLPAGRYELAASRAGYLSGQFGQKQPGRPGTRIQLADGADLGSLAITLFTPAVIAGMVTGETGEPLIGAEIRALRPTMTTGVRRWLVAGTAQADDRGAFRLFGLAPGDYVLRATYRDDVPAAETTGGTAETPAPVTFVPTFYPGTPSADNAVTVSVRGGEERAGTDITMPKVQTATLSGRVIAATGSLAGPVSVQLQSIVSAATGLPAALARVESDGNFTFRAVPPGPYTIVARATAPLPGTTSSSVPTTWLGRAVVSVDGAVVDAVVTIDGGRTLTGIVVFDGDTAPDLSRERITASLQPVPTDTSVAFPAPAPGAVLSDGRFTISGVPPGRYRLKASGAPGWSLKSSIVGGRDSLDFAFDVDDMDVAGAVITFAWPSSTTQLRGTVSDADGAAVVVATVVAFSADQQFWTAASRRIDAAQAASDGTYVLEDLPPGDYHVVALSDLEPGTQYDPDVLTSLVGASIRVSLGAGATLTQDLRVVRRRP